MEKKVKPESEDGSKREGVLAAYSRKTTIHGLQYVLSPEVGIIRRILWGVAVLVVLFIFFYWTYDIMVRFFAYSVNTAYTTRQVPTIDFPSVTICSQNPLRLTALSSAGTYSAIKNSYDNTTSWGEALIKAGLNATEVAMTAGPALADLVLSCQYGSAVCSAGSATWTSRLTTLGQCHTFTPPSGQSAPGDHGGLRLTLNTEAYETTYEIGGSPGVKILLHDSTDPPVLGENSISVSPGYKVAGQLSLIKFFRLPAPYGNCGDSGYPSERACQVSCMNQQIKTTCGCVPYYSAGSGDTVCNSSVELSCSKTIAYKFLTGDTSGNTGHCSCPTPCTEKDFSAQTTFSQLSETALSSQLSASTKSAMTSDFNQAQAAANTTGAPALPTALAYRDNIVEVEVFFRRLQYTSETQTVAYTFAQHSIDHFISLLVCFGMSIMSLLEFIDLLVVGIARCCGFCKNRGGMYV